MKRRMLTAFVCGLAVSSPAWFSHWPVADAVARGRAAAAGLGVHAGLLDRSLAVAFDAGGWAGAVAARSFIYFLAGALAMLAFQTLGIYVSRRWPANGLTRRLMVVLTVLITLMLIALGARDAVRAALYEERDMRVFVSSSLLDGARRARGPVFWNPSALNEIALYAPEFLKRPTLADRAAMIVSPVRWRERDRTEPAAAVVIVGQVAEARPLVRHLLASPDWRLALVDRSGLLFLRGAGPEFTPPSPEMVDRGFFGAQRAFTLARTALNYQEADLKVDARALMQKALDFAPEDPRVLACAASLAASQGLWEQARAHAEKALKSDPASPSAAFVLAQSLLETGASEKALELSARLVRRFPQDGAYLFLSARAARAAHDPTTEIESLERLLPLCERSGIPPAIVNVYLGQAWADRGFPDQAVAAYKRALQAGLSAPDAAAVRSAIQNIEDLRLNTRP